MKVFALAALAGAVLLVAGLACAKAADSASNDEEQAIRSILAEMMENWNNHDIKSFMSHFTVNSDAVTRVGQWIRSRDQHEEHLLELHQSPFRDQLIGRRSTVEDVRFLTPDVAVAHEVVEEKTGKSIRTYVLSKQAGQWKVEADAINVIAGPREVLNHFGQATNADAILDKAIHALGGEEKLSQIKAATWKTKGTISFGDHANQVRTQWTVQGLDHLRHEFEAEVGDNQVKGINVVAGDKGWRQFADNRMELGQDAVAHLKQHAYLAVIQIAILPLRSQQFKVEVASDVNINGQPAAGIRAIGPDGKEFKFYFDKDTGLPVRLVATVADFDGNEYTQETTFSQYRQIDGIKKATKIELKRDGRPFQEHELTEFRILDKVNPETFSTTP